MNDDRDSNTSDRSPVSSGTEPETNSSGSEDLSENLSDDSGRGRPRKPPEERRDFRQVTVRLSKREYEEIQPKAAGRSLSLREYLIAAAKARPDESVGRYDRGARHRELRQLLRNVGRKLKTARTALRNARDQRPLNERPSDANTSDSGGPTISEEEKAVSEALRAVRQKIADLHP